MIREPKYTIAWTHQRRMNSRADISGQESGGRIGIDVPSFKPHGMNWL